jgi:hypothetical protein
VPTVGLELEGAVVVVNSAKQPLDLPAGLEVSRSFDAPPASVSSGGDPSAVPNDLEEGDLVPKPSLTAPVAPLTSTEACQLKPTDNEVLAALPSPSLGATWCGRYVFSDLAAGEHDLSLDPPDGYTVLFGGGSEVVADASEATVARTIILQATSVIVEVAVDGVCGALPDAIVTLLPPGVTDPAQGIPMTWSPTSARFVSSSAVPPRVDDYTISVTHPLYADPLRQEPALTTTRSVTIDTDGNGRQVFDAFVVSTSARRASFSGDAKTLDTEGGTPQPLTSGSVTASTGTSTPLPAVAVGADGRYTVQVATAAVYSLRLDGVAGYLGDTETTTAARIGCADPGPTLQAERPATWTIVVSGTAATATDLTATFVGTAGTSTATITKSGSTFTVTGLDPRQASYQVKVSAGLHLSQTPTYTDPTVGGTKRDDVNLVRRTLTVTVSTDDNDADKASRATLSLRIPSDNTVPRVITGTGLSNTYEFTAINEGSGSLEISASGYLTRTVPVTEQQIAIADADAVLTKRVLTGEVTGLADTAARTVTLTASGSTTPLLTDVGTGKNFRFEKFPAGTYTVAVEALGYGTATQPVEASAATQPAKVFLTPRGRPIDVTVTLTGTATTTSGNTVVVTIGGVASAAQSVGGSTFVVSATEGTPLSYLAASSGTFAEGRYRTKTGEVSYTGATVANGRVAVALTIPLEDRPTITGTIVANNQASTANIELYCIETTVGPDTCADPAVAVATAAAAGSFSFRLDVGSWKVRAVAIASGEQTTETATIVVGATGAPTPPGPFTIDLKPGGN